jgi:WD40 repeat protein
MDDSAGWPVHNGNIETVSAEKMQYDGFLSYSAASDYQTARRVEAFLEAFHKLAPPAGAVIRQLHICRDGSDFKLPKHTGRESAHEDPIWEIIVSQLMKAKYLLVLCSPAATNSPWVAREVSWFIENRGRDSVLPLVTAGLDPIRNPHECFPEGLIAAGIHRERIWYDLRGRRSNVQKGVRDHEDEMVRVASDLLDWDAQTFGPLSTLWQREQLKVRQRQATLVSSVAAVLVLLAGFATLKAFQAREEAILARIASLVSAAGSQRDPATSVLTLNEVASLAGNSAPYGATNIAVRLARTIRPVAVLRGHQATVVSVAFNRLGDKLLTASQDGTARIWPADLRGLPTVFSGSGASLVEATFSHDDRLIVAASADGTARIWSTDGTTAPVVLRGHEQALRTARFSPDDALVITASEDATARIWSVAGGPSLRVLRGHNAAVRSAVFNSEGDRVVTASDDGTSKVWSTNGTSQPVNFGFPRRARFSSASFSPDGREVIVASSDGTGWIWSPASEFPFITLVGGSASLSSAAFSPNGKWIVTAQLGRVQVWKTDGLNPLSKTNESYLSFDTHSLVRKAVFSSDSTRVAAVGEDGSARVWTIDGSQEELLMGSHEAPVLDVAFSHDGTRIATASSDSTIRIWDVAPASEPVIADVHLGPKTPPTAQAEYRNCQRLLSSLR